MRLIDADALKKRIEDWVCAPERCGDNYNGVRCRACTWDDAIGYIESEPTVDAVPPEVVTSNCVPIKPLARWLMWYAFPPTMKARHVVGRGADEVRKRAEAEWIELLRGMDWRTVESDGE